MAEKVAALSDETRRHLSYKMRKRRVDTSVSPKCVQIELDRAHRICTALETSVVKFDNLHRDLTKLLDRCRSLIDLVGDRARTTELARPPKRSQFISQQEQTFVRHIDLEQARRAKRRNLRL